jgi:hypothetical protein
VLEVAEMASAVRRGVVDAFDVGRGDDEVDELGDGEVSGCFAELGDCRGETSPTVILSRV